MSNKNSAGLLRLFVVALTVGVLSLADSVNATELNDYVSQSVLSSGRWMKLRVDTTGIQEITYEELRAAGFSDPSRVAVYGYGGVRHTMRNAAAATDDLPPVPVLHAENKILFYGESVTRVSVTPDGYISRDRNVYSTAGYYFITDSQPAREVPQALTPDRASGRLHTTHTSCYIIEEDVECPSRGGTEFFAHDMTRNGGRYDVALDVVDRVQNSNVNVRYRYAAHSVASVAVDVQFPGTVSVSAYSPGRCTGVMYDEIAYYTRADGSFSFRPNNYARRHCFDIGFTVPAGPTFAAVDYVAVSYERKNDISGMSSLEMFCPKGAYGDEVSITGWNPRCHVWTVNSMSDVSECEVTAAGVFRVSQPEIDRYYLFDPAMTQHKATLEPGIVAAQNLHGDEVPEMLIVTSKELEAEAEELAMIHARYQNMDVRVVVQDEIFNEFGSGTPHPEAYRNLARMYFGRNPEKFRSILLYGGCRYDNRMALARDSAAVLTYQCELIQYQNLSTTVYCSDAYFGMLHRSIMPEEVFYTACDVSVGRLPVYDSRQAKFVNGKIRRYLESPVSGTVMNRALVICDDKDRNSHLNQAEKMIEIINNATGGSVTCAKVYHALYPLDSNNDASAGRRMIQNTLQDGVAFMCYTGHTNGIYLTGHRIWGIGSISETVVENPPLVMWSTCDAYEFDRSRSDLTQSSVFMPEGGAIGAIGACRTVYQDYNGVLMYALTDSLYRSDPGVFLGDVFRRARNGVIAKAVSDSDPKLGVNTLCYNYCGDPALPLYNPSCRISAAVDGGALRTLAVNSLSGAVLTPDGNIAADFNGKVTITVYDSPYTRNTYPRGADEIVSVTLDEEVLVEKTVPVVNGRFNAELFVPHSVRSGADMRVSMAASSHDGVRGGGALQHVPVNLSSSMPDDITSPTAPVIDRVYIDRPDFEAGDVVGSDCCFYAVIHAGMSGVNVSGLSVGMSPDLRLDGRHAVKMLINYLDNGDMLLSGRMRDLLAGEHSLELRVADNLGNHASRILDFIVGDVSHGCLIPDKTIVSDRTVIAMEHSADKDPVCRLVVEDASGNMVFNRDNVSFPYTWELTDNKGERVSDGRYRIYSTFKVGDVYGYTAPVDVAVVAQSR